MVVEAQRVIRLKGDACVNVSAWEDERERDIRNTLLRDSLSSKTLCSPLDHTADP